MSRLRTIICVLITIVGFVLPLGTVRADPSDISAASRSVVRVVVYSSADGQRTMVGSGSGVVIAPDKVVTNAHVVEPSRYDESISFVIVPSEGTKSYNAILKADLPGKDLALLQLAEGSLIPASFFSGIVPDGADVFAVGYPASVDIALEQGEDDVLRPQIPVKTRGSISTGRTSKSVESLLHTAPIAPGNSGGPLLDACGRVLGINSFGSVADGGGAEFYFAVSARELSSFLADQGVNLRSVTGECRSVAELTRAEADRDAAARAKIEAEARIATELNRSREGKVRNDAEHAVIGERENHMAFAGLLLVLSAIAGGAAWQFTERGQRGRFKIAAGVGSVALLAALFTYLARPSFDEVDERVRLAMTKDIEKQGLQKPVFAATGPGKKRCVIQPERSRITSSDTADILFEWSNSGCINGRTQYAESGGTWTRGFVPTQEAQVSMVSYAPDSRTYRIERYLLGMDAMEKAREARKRYEVKTCLPLSETIEKVDNMNKALREVLPQSPNEILVFACSAG